VAEPTAFQRSLVGSAAGPLLIAVSAVGYLTTVGSDRDGAKRGSTSAGDESRLRRIVKILGPGLVTGASDDDPSGIATYAQAGAQFRNSTLWTVLVGLPLMIAVQEICDRTALATGESLGRLAHRRFERNGRIVVGVLLVALLIANILNIAADLMAMGAGMRLLHAGSAVIWSVVGGLAITGMLVMGSFELVAKVIRWLCLSLFSYLAVVFSVKVDWGDVVRGLVLTQPRFTASYGGIIAAIFGATISPYLFFWQSVHRVEELRVEGPHHKRPLSLRRLSRAKADEKETEARADVLVGMLLSQVVMFAIIVATAATLGRHGQAHIDSAAQAAKALQPIAGRWATTLFALGFIGTGTLAVPILAGSAAVGISGLVDKKWGFDRSPRKAPLFYGLITVGTLGGTLLSALAVNPMHLLVIVAVVNGVAAAPFLVLTMLIASNEPIMGEYRNGWLATTVGWLAVVMMAGVGAVGIYQTFVG